jgi:hypothetical protein
VQALSGDAALDSLLADPEVEAVIVVLPVQVALQVRLLLSVTSLMMMMMAWGTAQVVARNSTCC